MTPAGAATPGTLFFVVGPSGSGKDTLIDGARGLEATGRFAFARRVITRPAGSAGEDHDALDEAGFAAREAAGGFLVAWSAHGLRYGIPAETGRIVRAGLHVVANGSRAVIADIAGRVPRLVVVEIWAPDEVLAARLAGRGREAGEAIAARLVRRVAEIPAGVTVLRVANDATPEIGIARFVAALSGCSPEAPGDAPSPAGASGLAECTKSALPVPQR